MRIPISQLTYTFDKENFMGLAFPEELDYDVHSFIYALPLYLPKNPTKPTWEEIHDGLFENSYYLPCEFDGEYVEVNGEFEDNTINDFPNLIFTVSRTRKLVFEIDLQAVSQFYRKANIRVKKIHTYIGRYDFQKLSQFFFVPLIPRSIDLINQIFQEDKGLIVGYSPSFGEFEFLKHQ